MTIITPDFDFSKEVTCTYKGDGYSVRDNGSILRHPCKNGRKRRLDNNWTFGKSNERTGYMEIASKRVHRIVTYAFHGEPPTDKHVVDHIDTNKQNNRPENLRWVTRLENLILNPITSKRIALVCGSVEAFLAEPSRFRAKFLEPNLAWMGRVSKSDARTCLVNLTNWANSDKTFSGGALDKWIFNRQNNYMDPLERYYVSISERSEIIPSNIIQKNWGTESKYPCCPSKVSNNPISEYAANLVENSVFFHNAFYSTIVLKKEIIEIGKSLLVLFEIKKRKNKITRWGIMNITFENRKYAHEIIRNYNRTLEHYWLIDAENHFNSIVNRKDWVPLFDSQGREFGGDYMPL